MSMRLYRCVRCGEQTVPAGWVDCAKCARAFSVPNSEAERTANELIGPVLSGPVQQAYRCHHMEGVSGLGCVCEFDEDSEARPAE